MTQRELDLKAIIHEFSVWEVNLKNHNSLNLQDVNIFSEYTVCEIVNCIFGYRLKSANSLVDNHPSVDLVDLENRIAIQVTTTKTSLKIQETIDKFIAHRLQNSYDTLYILILGRRQSSYPTIKIPSELSFDPKKNILDFKVLLNHIAYLPSVKLDRLKAILQKTVIRKTDLGLSKVEAMQKKTLSMKKKFYKNFIENNSSLRDNNSFYSSRCYFEYGSAIVREVGDRTFPGGDPNQPKWQKCEFFDMYEYGVQFIRQAGYILVDADGFWDLDSIDEQSENPDYKKVPAWVFYYLSFENMVEFEMQPDGYYGYPTIFCHFKHEGWPFERIRFGRLGNENELHPAYYFDDTKRKQLL